MTELDILELLAQTSSKNEKKAILKRNKGNKRLADLLDAGLNFFRKFHIHKFDMPIPAKEKTDNHSSFMRLLSGLENREITGNQAKLIVEEFFRLCTAKEQLWYSRVLQKDLNIGISVDTVIEFFPMPTFDVQLATDGKKCKNLNKIIESGVFASPKLDGYRCLAVIAGGSVNLYSRNGSEYKNFTNIEKSLLDIFGDNDIVFDGEIMSDDFQAMQQSAFANTRGTTVGDVRFHVFDVIDINEWKNDNFKQIKSLRIERLKNLSLLFDNNLVLVDQELVDTVDKVLALEKQYLALGYEGVMVVPDIPYYKGRKANRLMKFKTMLSQDCEVIGLYEGKAGTKHEGRMGGLVLMQENGLICECGTGFSDEDRHYMWQNQAEFLGKIAEIKYQELTNHNIMRFPVFMRWRNDKTRAIK